MIARRRSLRILLGLLSAFAGVVAVSSMPADDLATTTESADLPKAFIDGNGPGWRSLGEADFVNVNCAPDTWSFEEGLIKCTGQPVGIMRTAEKFTNFELVVEWRHQLTGGNSGVFLWMIDESLEGLQPGGLPHGIEVQVLDHGYAEQYRASQGKDPDWFTTNGDVFPTGAADMVPFEPTAPGGSKRSFPRKNLSKGIGEWNHYYVRAINGEVRLWVNGEEVSGGHDCQPATGYLGLESEGAPIEFRNLRIRPLP
jgi:hypothetical protein